MDNHPQLEVQIEDVVKLIQQFCKEQMLPKTLAALQEETNVAMNTVDNLEVFLSDINNGHWDHVLQVVSTVKLPTHRLIELYEHIIFEMLELRETECAKSILRATEPMMTLKNEQPERYMRLERMCANQYFEAKDAYQDVSKERRRANIAAHVASEVSVVPASRLLVLIGQALKWQQHQGMLPPGHQFDVFRSKAPTVAMEEETYPKENHRVVKFGKKSHAHCLAFSPDGQYLVSGSSDGFVEVWDYETGKLRKDLKYQMNDEIMMHEEGVLSLAFSRDSDLLATGDKGGKIKVWKVATGQCLRRFDKAHSDGVTCVAFARDGTQVLSGSSDNMLRIHGLKSGKALKEFRGHTSYVNDCIYTHDGSRVISCSSDGTVKIWDAKSQDCVMTIRPPSTVMGIEVTINKIVLNPRNTEHIIVCNRSSQIVVMTQAGQVVKTFSNSKKDVNFVTVAPSPRGDWLHAVGEDGQVYSFNVKNDSLDNVLTAHERECHGVSHHPHRNLTATISDDGTMRLWKPARNQVIA